MVVLPLSEKYPDWTAVQSVFLFELHYNADNMLGSFALLI